MLPVQTPIAEQLNDLLDIAFPVSAVFEGLIEVPLVHSVHSRTMCEHAEETSGQALRIGILVEDVLFLGLS